MNDESSSAVRPLTPEMRDGLILVAILVFLAGIQLYILTEHTDQYFAWTIKSFLTAACLGAGYWASFLPSWIALRKNVWADLRVTIPGVAVFSSLVLLATLLHLDKFHMNHPAGWVWLLVYIVVPPGLVVLLIRQLRLPGGDPPPQGLLPAWSRWVFGLQTFLTLPLGVGLYILHPAVLALWPWDLTPLTAQTIASALLTIAVTSFTVVRENDFGRVRLAGIVYTGYGVLQGIALARYPHEVRWGSPGAWIWCGLLLSILGMGLYVGKKANPK